jgi:hypothetical protein
MSLPKLSPGLAQQLMIRAKEFTVSTPLALMPGKGLVVCFEGKAFAWIPDLTQVRPFPVGAFAVDCGAGAIYVRTQAREWVFNFSLEGGAA